ncbi:MAG: hypothetical protein ACSHWZ_08520 [Sulfitobacter sp.]
MTNINSQRVKTRRVFYIPGYDPIHPRRYRELYRKESAAQAAISGYKIALSANPAGRDTYGWQVRGDMDGAVVNAEIEVLVWSDIVRQSMSGSIPETYLHLAKTAWVYIRTGALWRLMRLRKGPVIAALYPVAMLLLQLLIGLVAAASTTLAGRALLPAPWGLLLGLLLGAALCVLILRWFKAKDGKFYAYYLMHDYSYGARTQGANRPELETRMDQFRAAIAQALASDVDEVLVVGHSSGAHLGVSVLADLIRAGQVPPSGPALGFLSLGQVVPMVSFLPRAWRLRADLAFLSTRTELTWVDVTAPGDGCAFALCDPVSVSGVAPSDKRWPLVISAAFTQTLSAERWKELRWRFFRLHFQYLCAFDRVKDYDYFRITAGALTLAKRYENRVASKSKIDTPVNKFTSTAP